MLTQASSERLLEKAFVALFNYVVTMPTTGIKDDGAPVFSYLMTPKQIGAIQRICAANGWPGITTHGIEISVHALRHVLVARRGKDRISDDEILQTLTKAYSPRSVVRINRSEADRVRHRQSLLLNAQQKIRIGNTMFHGLAVLQLRTERSRTYLAPVTCYHATEAKIRAIEKHG